MWSKQELIQKQTQFWVLMAAGHPRPLGSSADLEPRDCSGSGWGYRPVD